MKKVLILLLILFFSVTLFAAAGLARRGASRGVIIKPLYKNVAALAFPGCLKCGCLYEVKNSAGRDVASVDLSQGREDAGCDCDCHKNDSKTSTHDNVAEITLD